VSNSRKRLALLAPLTALSLGFAACGDDGSVSSGEIEDKATTVLSKKVGQTPKSISCPNDLDAKAGASETCVITAEDGSTVNMTATVKSVDGDNAQLDFQVADHIND